MQSPEEAAPRLLHLQAMADTALSHETVKIVDVNQAIITIPLSEMPLAQYVTLLNILACLYKSGRCVSLIIHAVLYIRHYDLVRCDS